MSRPAERAPYRSARDFVEEPGTSILGLLVGTIALLLVALIGWTAWATVDEIVRAPGRVEPAGQVKLINHPHGGKVAEILVHEGQQVSEGAVLLRLDPRLPQHELQELQGRLELRRAEIARLLSEADGVPFEPPPELRAARPDLIEAQRELLEARTASLDSRAGALAETVEQRRGELAIATADLERIRHGLVFLEQQIVAIRELAARGLYPKLRLVSAEKELADARGQRSRAASALEAAKAALAEAEARLAGLDREWRSRVLDELSAARAEEARLAQQLGARRTVLEDLEITAPVDGTVLDLAVTAPGQSIAANETVMRLVPEDGHLIVEARVANEDIGRVRLGMAATVKVRAYDYLRHGTLTGEVVRIAADATPEPLTGRLSYVAAIRTGGEPDMPRDLVIAPGMIVDVELTAGERTILSYFTDRIWKIRDAAFRDG